MAIAIDPLATWEVEIEGTLFKIGVLTVRDVMRIKDFFVTEDLNVRGTESGGVSSFRSRRSTHTHEAMCETVKAGLKGWRRFRDHAGDEVAFDDDMELNLNRLKPSMVEYLALAIDADRNIFTRLDAKNYDAPSTPTTDVVEKIASSVEGQAETSDEKPGDATNP